MWQIFETAFIDVEYSTIQCITAVIDVKVVYDVLNMHVNLGWRHM